jgi:predicted oxidoreductase
MSAWVFASTSLYKNSDPYWTAIRVNLIPGPKSLKTKGSGSGLATVTVMFVMALPAIAVAIGVDETAE